MAEPPTPRPVPTTAGRAPGSQDDERHVPHDTSHRIFGSTRPPSWPRTIRLLAIALAIAVLCWFLGADVWHSILFGSALTLLGLLFSVVPDRGDIGWRGGERRSRDGARNDVAVLSWSLRTGYGRIGNATFWRVQQLARHRLATIQLDLNDPADRDQIEHVIGSRAYAVLVPGAGRPPYLRSLLHCLDVLDALDPTRPTHLASRAAAPPDAHSAPVRGARAR